MNIAEKTVLITGANRGIGEALVKEKRRPRLPQPVDPNIAQNREQPTLDAGVRP